MDSPERCSKETTTTSPIRNNMDYRRQDPTLSPVFHSIFDAETVVLSPSSISNLSQSSDVPTIIFGDAPIASPVRIAHAGGCAVAKPVHWYAIRKSIHGKTLMVTDWRDCEPHVKVWNSTKTEKVIPYGVDFHKFHTFEEAAAFLFK